MFITYKNTKVYYEVQDGKKSCILFLHGWGCSNEIMKPLARSFTDSKKVFVDFPPFGESEEPKNVWFLDDYVNIILQILKQNKIKKVKIIAHSFGVRVAILLAQKYNIVCKLVFLGGAGLVLKKSFKTRLKFFRNCLRKKLGLSTKNLGSADYKKLSPIMKQTFNNIILKDLKNESKKLTQKVLLIYGKNDHETPISLAKKFNKYIKNSKLIIVKKAGHFVWVDNFFEVQNHIFNFLN